MTDKIIVTLLMFMFLTILGFANGIYFIAVKTKGLKDYVYKNTLSILILMDSIGIGLSIATLCFIARN